MKAFAPRTDYLTYYRRERQARAELPHLPLRSALARKGNGRQTPSVLVRPRHQGSGRPLPSLVKLLMDTILGKGRAGKRLTAKSRRCRKERVNLLEQFVIPELHDPSAPGFRQCCRLLRTRPIEPSSRKLHNRGPKQSSYCQFQQGQGLHH